MNFFKQTIFFEQIGNSWGQFIYNSQTWIENSLFPDIFLNNWVQSLHFDHVLFTCYVWYVFFSYRCGTVAELRTALPNPFDLLWSAAHGCFFRTVLSERFRHIAQLERHSLRLSIFVFSCIFNEMLGKHVCLQLRCFCSKVPWMATLHNMEHRTIPTIYDNLSMFWYLLRKTISSQCGKRATDFMNRQKNSFAPLSEPCVGQDTPKKNQSSFFSKSQLEAKHRERELAEKQSWISTLGCAAWCELEMSWRQVQETVQHSISGKLVGLVPYV